MHLIKLTRELGRFPIDGDLLLKTRQDVGFPNRSTFNRLGSKTERVSRVIAYCTGREGFEDVLAICSQATMAAPVPADAEREDTRDRDVPIGYVYLLRYGRHYKIGKTNAFGRRERELAIQLPDRAHTVHVIRTDDPAGIEEYWHKRFASKRGNGEWFDLDPADVRAFKRRKFM
jgi:Meiotically Up-regulated Gene 113 (MUG113) protein